MAERINVTSPVGRFVAGSLYKPNDKNFDGKPLLNQSGQPRVSYYIALAIAKTPGKHWAHEEWGSIIWQTGHRDFPQAAQRPDFAWKIEDGDSQIPNLKGQKPCEKEGYPGHWILKFSGGFAPKIVFAENGQWVQNLTVDAIKPGYYVQVAFSVAGNDQASKPGVYLNYQAVAFRSYGPEIVFGPNVEEMNFGQAPLPPGASAVPIAAVMPSPGAPPPPGQPYPPPNAPAPPAYVGMPPAPAVPVYPNPQMLQVPQAPAPGAPAAPSPGVPAVGSPYLPPGMPAPPVVGPAAIPVAPAYPSNQPQYRMTAKAGAITYEAYMAAGWDNAKLIAEGLMTV